VNGGVTFAPMRLAVFTNEFPSTVSTFFARDVRALLEQGIEIDVFAFYNLDPSLWQWTPAILPPSVFPRSRVHHMRLGRSLLELRPWPLGRARVFLAEAAVAGFSAIPAGLGAVAKTLYVLPKAWAWARRVSTPYDYVLAYWGNYAATCAQMFRRLVAPEAAFSMFLHANADLYRNPVSLPRKLLDADNVFLVSEFNRGFLRQKYPDLYPRVAHKLYVHHLGLDLENFPVRLEGRDPGRILAVGRLIECKGFDYMVRAAQALLQRGTAVQIELIGDGPARPHLEALSRELNLGERICFRGHQTFAEVQAAMSRAALLVHPSRRLGDGVPTVIKEAQAVGLPVVGTEVGGIPELLDHGHAGVLVPPEDVGALAAAIQRLLADDVLRREYACAGRTFAEKHYNMWTNGKRLAAILRETPRRGARSERG